MARFAVFKVQRQRALNTSVSVAYATVDGTATVEGGDYTPVSGTLIFGPGETEKEVRVPVRNTQESAAEQFTLKLSNPVRAGFTVKEAAATIPAGASGLESQFLLRDLDVLFYSGEGHPGVPGQLSDTEWKAVPGTATQDDSEGNETANPFPGYYGQFILNAGPFQVRAGGGAIVTLSGWYFHYLVAATPGGGGQTQLMFGDKPVCPPTQQLDPSTQDAFNAWWDAKPDGNICFYDIGGTLLGSTPQPKRSTDPDRLGGDATYWATVSTSSIPWDFDLNNVAKIALVPLS